MSRHLDSSTTTQMAQIMVEYGRSSRSSWAKSVAGLLWRKAIWEHPFEVRLREIFHLDSLFVHREKGYSYLFMWMTSNWLERKKISIRCRNYSTKKLIWKNQHPSSIMCIWYVPCEMRKDIVDNNRTMFEFRISARATEKLPCSENMRIPSWSYDMEGHAKKCVERYCELANRTTQQLYKVSTHCIDDHHFKEEELNSEGELSKVCSQIVLRCVYLARVGRPDILWSVNKLARSISKCTKACDKRLIRLISYIHQTCDNKQYCHVGNTAKQCRLGLFQDSDFAGDLGDSKSTSGGTLCAFFQVIHLFQ